MALIFVSGNTIWFFEKGSGVFSDNYLQGIIEAFWWTISTISTVGYGDFAPATLLGRLTASFIILVGLIVFGIYIAETTSMLTLAKMKYRISSPLDLKGKKVATKNHSTSVKTLKNLKCNLVKVNKIENAYILLEQNKVDAVVFDAPTIMHYLIENPESKLIMTGNIFATQTYGFAFPIESTLRDKINAKLLEIRETGEYEQLYHKWFSDNKYN